MKTAIFKALAAVALLTLHARAQDVFVSGPPGSVNYYAVTPLVPVTFQVPAACQAPAACQVSRPCAVPVPCARPALVCQSSSPNVIYFGGPYSQCRSYSSCAGSPVIYFGRGQAYRQGYLFGLPR